jgi:peptide-methionine (S)-S-oxide reductase
MSFLDRLNEAKTRIPSREEALPGRAQAITVPDKHYVLATPMVPPFPEQMELLMFGMGCFWGAEKAFWTLPGVFTTAVGYAAGYTPNPTYEEVCTGRTGHNEVVLVVFDPAVISYSQILSVFWENHNPTQGMRQGNDIGTQYRSGIYVTNDREAELAQASLARYQQLLDKAGFGAITTEIVKRPEFYYAEHYHQQYLAKNPNGYCGMGGTGVSFPSQQ